MGNEIGKKLSPGIQEQIKLNQEQFVKKFKRSFFGAIYDPVWKRQGLTGTDDASRSEYIKRVYRLKTRNFYLSINMKLRSLKFCICNHWRMPKIRYHGMDEFVIMAIVKNEGRYIKEWLDFHLLVGADRFYIFDNGSTDDTGEILKPYVEKGIAEVIPIPNVAQIPAYNMGISLLKKRAKWAAIIDADEFLFPVGNTSIKEFLKSYEDAPAVGVNWVVYGPCGNKTRPEGLITENYTKTFKNKNHDLNCRVKSIIQPSRTMCSWSSHSFVYTHGDMAVDENKCLIEGDAMYASYGPACTWTNSSQKIRINHYWTKSEEDLREKICKGRPDGCAQLQYESTLEVFRDDLKEDHEIDKYVSLLKKRYGNTV